MARNKLKPLSPIALAIDTIDQTIRQLKCKRQELVALLPKQTIKITVDTTGPHPLTGRKLDYKKNGKRYADKRRPLLSP